MTTATLARPRRLNPIRVFSFVIGAVISVGLAIYLLLPFFWMVKSAFQPAGEISAAPPIWLPTSPTLDNFRDALAMMPFLQQMGNSLLVGISAALLTTIISSMAAYITARSKLRIVGVVLGILVLNQLLPEITRLIPVYFMLEDFGLINTYLGMILTYTGFATPFAALVLHGYFQSSCPAELEEAASIDGCSRIGTFFRVFLPVSRTGLVAVSCIVFLQIWNDFIWASAILFKGDVTMLQVGLRSFLGLGGNVQYMGPFMAACLLTLIPAFVLFLFIQKYMAAGLSAGALKG
ncbi:MULTISPECIES: carbohydrate ABC transporter permease [unclassified Salinibacterium]|uniref:carbohydrate ABC transporter permease n=1 Tax=unclassified Salinibacterium TaxID=2632331 RepID=UPI0014209F01|nr:MULTISPECIES: carbohydrate ABC transporter permease [unclassified Salinibacterium]